MVFILFSFVSPSKTPSGGGSNESWHDLQGKLVEIRFLANSFTG